jgi:hypothetical protein
MRWFRFYDDALHDPKVQKLPPVLFKAWINVLCIASRNEGKLPGLDDICFELRVDEDRAAEWLKALSDAGLLDCIEGVWRPHNWDGRQFKSDGSTERVRRFRQKEQNVTGATARNVSETLHETGPEQIQRQKQIVPDATHPPSPADADEASASDFPKRAFLDHFWPAYPLKVGKDAAARKFDALRRSGRVSFADLMAGLDAYKRNKPPDRDWCHATTWMNQGRWADEYDNKPGAGHGQHRGIPGQTASDRTANNIMAAFAARAGSEPHRPVEPNADDPAGFDRGGTVLDLSPTVGGRVVR